MVVYTQNKNQCSECGNAFGQKGDLTRHMVVQTKEKCHQCSECRKAFGHKGHLKTHMVIHTQEKKYLLCSECGRHLVKREN
jgi:KRAB domain-containing zinc finger protein